MHQASVGFVFLAVVWVEIQCNSVEVHYNPVESKSSSSLLLILIPSSSSPKSFHWRVPISHLPHACFLPVILNSISQFFSILLVLPWIFSRTLYIWTLYYVWFGLQQLLGYKLRILFFFLCIIDLCFSHTCICINAQRIKHKLLLVHQLQSPFLRALLKEHWCCWQYREIISKHNSSY